MGDASLTFRCVVSRTTTLAATFIAACLVATTANADPKTLPPQVGYNYGQTEEPRIAATGGALRATSNSTAALFLNPANMAASRVYHVGAFAQIWPQAGRQSYGAAIVDSIVSSSGLAGGFGGSWSRQDPEGLRRTWVDLRFALAYPFSKSFFAGLAGRYLGLKQEGYPRGIYQLPPSVAAGGLNDEAMVKAVTFDAGMTFKPIDELAISVVGYNLTDADHSFLPMMVGGGIGYGSESLTLEADVLGDFASYEKNTTRVMLGGEYLIAGAVPLRAGYRYDQGAVSHTVTGGLGYLTEAYEVSASVQRVVAGDSATVIVVGFKYHVESTGISPGASF
jgi:hypothetical protein